MTPKPFDFDIDDRLDAYSAGVAEDEAARAAVQASNAARALDDLLDEIEVDISCGDFGGDDLTPGARELLASITQNEDKFPRDLWVKNPRIYWAKLLIEREAEEEDALLADFEAVMRDANYKKAKVYAKASSRELFARIEALEGKHAAEMARRMAEEEAKQRTAEEAKRKAEEEAGRKAEEEARRKATEEAERRAEEEARRRMEELRGKGFEIDENGVLTGYQGKDTDVLIPNEVTSIGKAAFNGCNFLVSVMIPNSVTSIGDGAFGYCRSLVSVTIPNSVMSVGNGVFAFCKELDQITVSNGNPSYHIENGCLIETATKTIVRGTKQSVIPAGTKVIGNLAFSECDLKSMTIPNSVTSIGVGAFNCCHSLFSVTIPNSVTSIGALAFAFCDSLTSVTIPNSVTSIGDYAFCQCDSLASVNIPNSVTSIGDYAFYNCSSLTSITIPSSVTSIGKEAFCDCKSLTSATISRNCSIGKGAFPDTCRVIRR